MRGKSLFLLGGFLLVSILLMSGVFAADNCTDTDSGLDYYTKGTISPLDKTDSCDNRVTNRLAEYSCTPNQYGNPYHFYICPNGCEDGACIQEDVPEEPIVVDDDCGVCAQIVIDCAEGYRSAPNGYDDCGCPLGGRCIYIGNETVNETVNETICGFGDTCMNETEITCGNDVCDTLGIYITEGTPKIVSFEDASYDIKISYVTSEKVGLVINGESTVGLGEGDSTKIDDGTMIYVNTITYWEKDSNRSSHVLIYLGENRVSCAQDCNIACTDTDGGFDYFVKGCSSGLMWDGSFKERCDSCSNLPSNPTPMEECSGSDCRVTEYGCNAGVLGLTYTAYCSNGCIDGACVSEECERVENFMASPTNLTIGYDEWTLGNSDSYISDHSEDRSYYADFYKQTEWGHDSAYVSLRVIDPNYYYTIEERMENMLDRGLCQQRKIYFETEETITGEYNEDYEIVYVCQDLWSIADDQKNVNNPYWNDRNSVETIWFNGDMLFRVSSYSINYNGNCFDYESCQDREEEAHRRQQGDIAEVLGNLLDNQAEYPGGFYLDWDVEQVIKYLLDDCGSKVKESVGYQGSWQCKLEPAVCPPHGYQEEICEKYNYNSEDRDDRYDTRKTQIQCNPGLCSGCYVPRWFGGSELDSKCIPYGFRFAHQTGWTIEEVYSEDKDQEGLSVGEANDWDDLDLEVYEDGTALLSIYERDFSVNISLVQGETYDWDELTGEGGDDWQYDMTVDEIVYDSNNYEDSYIQLTFFSAGTYERRTKEAMNAYCDMDGNIKQQKTVNSRGDWANCQNNYECESNLCSSGECIEVTKMIADASLMKKTGVRLWCTFARMSPDITYDSCIFDLLGESSIPEEPGNPIVEVPSDGGSSGSSS